MALRETKKSNFSEAHYAATMLSLAYAEASKSNDPVRKVGCVITLAYEEADNVYSDPRLVPVIGAGFNSIPDGITLQDKNDHVIHAEGMAVANARSNLASVEGTENARERYVRVPTNKPLTAFVTRMPCRECMTALSDMGVGAVMFSANDERLSKWLASFDAALAFAKSRGVAVSMVTIHSGGLTIDTLMDHDAYPREAPMFINEHESAVRNSGLLA